MTKAEFISFTEFQAMKLTTKAYSSEFIRFDLPTKRNFLFIMQFTGSRTISIVANGLCTFQLSLPLFLSVKCIHFRKHEFG